MRDVLAVAEHRRVGQFAVDANHGQRRLSIRLGCGLELDGYVPVVRLLRHRDLLHVGTGRQQTGLCATLLAG